MAETCNDFPDFDPDDLRKLLSDNESSSIFERIKDLAEDFSELVYDILIKPFKS